MIYNKTSSKERLFDGGVEWGWGGNSGGENGGNVENYL